LRVIRLGQGRVNASARVRTPNQEKEMNKLLSVIVAAMFAVSATAFVASPVSAQMKDEKAAAAKKEAQKKKAAPKKQAAPKKTQKKGEAAKKEEMKK
jgi:hypothetical protein